MAAILEGIKVLDLTRMIAGPSSTQILADFGATVYKVERPGEGDDTRRIGPFLPAADGGESSDSAFYIAYNRGKQSITVDISTPEGAQLLRSLAQRCDIVVENYKVGNLARYGLDYDSLKALKPELIYCSITGFGGSGPYASLPAYDAIMQGMAGLMSSCGQPLGTPGSEPLRTAVPITDIVTGLHAAVAVLGALHHLRRTGEGQHIDISLMDAAVSANGHLATEYLMTGQAPRRNGNANPVSAPSEVFQCHDGALIVVAGNNRQFVNLCQALDLPGLPSDPRFLRNADRIAHRTELHAAIESVTSGLTRAELMRRLAAAGVPAGPINTLEEVFADPQVRVRGMAVTARDGAGRLVPLVRNPIRFAKAQVRHEAPPSLGQDTQRVLRDELALSEESIAHLKQAGVI